MDVLSELMTLQSYPVTVPPITTNESYYPVAQAQNCMCNTVSTYKRTEVIFNQTHLISTASMILAYNIGSACQDCQRGTTDQGILFSLYVAGGDLCPSTSDRYVFCVYSHNPLPPYVFAFLQLVLVLTPAQPSRFDYTSRTNTSVGVY